jgi:hypothetical protein
MGKLLIRVMTSPMGKLLIRVMTSPMGKLLIRVMTSPMGKLLIHVMTSPMGKLLIHVMPYLIVFCEGAAPNSIGHTALFSDTVLYETTAWPIQNSAVANMAS